MIENKAFISNLNDHMINSNKKPLVYDTVNNYNYCEGEVVYI